MGKRTSVAHQFLTVLVFVSCSFFITESAVSQNKTPPKVLLAGVLENWPPQYSTDKATGKPTGFAIDILQAVAKRSGYQVVFIPYRSWSELTAAAINGEVDLIPNMGITEKRRTDFLFTKPYETFYINVFVRSAAADIENLDDLRNKTIGVVVNNVGVDLVGELVYRNLKSYESLEKAFFEMLSGAVDALIYPAPTLEEFASISGLKDRIRLVGDPLLEIKRAIAIKKNRVGLYVELNKSMQSFLESDDYQEIYAEWYHTPEPFWDVRSVVLVMSVFLGLVVLMMIIWRFVSIWRLNLALQQTITEKEKTQTALMESESRFRQLAENIREVFWIVSPNWSVVEYISPTYEDVWGRSCQSLYKNPFSWTEAIVEEDRDEVERFIAKKSAGDYSNIVFPTYRIKKPDGAIRWISAKGVAIFNEQGEVSRIAGIAADVTEKKLAELELKASEERIRLLLNYSGEAIYGVNLEGNCTFANPACVKALGYRSQDELLHKNMHNLIHNKKANGEALSRSECRVYRVMKTGKMDRVTGEVFWKADGTSFPVEYISSPILRDGVIVGSVISFEDITKRLEIENELRRTRDELEVRVEERTEEIARLQRAVEQSSNVVVITDYEGVIEYVNPKFYSVYGYTEDEVMGQKTSILKADNLGRDEFRILWETVKSGNSWRGEFHNLKKDGSRTWQLASISPVTNTTGVITHFIAAQESIDEVKEAEFALQTAREEAEKANQAKSAFLANMSHELRTPLNAIIGFTQILNRQGRGSMTEKQSRFLNRIKEAGDHLLQMVNDVLDLSKIEADKVELDPKPFDFGLMLDRSPLTIQSIAQKKNIIIEKEIEEDLGWYVGDETRIKQVIFNFLSNAFKFTPSGKKIGIKAWGEDDRIHVKIWDEGIGISQENLERIFTPFEQIKNHTISEQGTGLGLAITRRLVELHGGTIQVESELGKGSSFTIIFPGRIENADIPAKEDLLTSPEKHLPLPSDKRILITEDNENNRLVIEAVLEDEVFDVDYAVSAEEALEMVEDKAYNLILMDIQLPGKSGTEAMKEIKNRHQVPIVAVTAFAMKGDRQKYLDEGFDGYLSKPLDLKKLKEQIYVHLS